MHIDRWWGKYVGGSDDSLSLVEYFARRKQSVIRLSEVLDDLHFENRAELLTAQARYFLEDGAHHVDFQLAVDVVIDLSAILLESLHSGRVTLAELSGDTRHGDRTFSIQADRESLTALLSALETFIREPGESELAEMVPEEALAEVTQACAEIRGELVQFLS